jgi:CDP-diglyceride synthetase
VVTTAKLVVTFSAAVAATFVAGTLQVADQDNPVTTQWDWAATWAMAAAAAVTIVVVVLPSRHHQGELDEHDLNDARSYARCVNALMVVQLVLSVVASIIATIGLLHPKWV